MGPRVSEQLEPIMDSISAALIDKHKAREHALPLCREAVRHSANAIRAVHRQEFTKARELIEKARALITESNEGLRDQPSIYHAGFVNDAQKEYVEASATYAIISGQPLPTPEELTVEPPAYLNGLGEVVGELRRYLLDTLRSGDVGRCEEILTAMDDIYSVLVTVDYPDAMTSGLRRTTDSVRGILERTRGDLTVSVRQRELERKLDAFKDKLS